MRHGDRPVVEWAGSEQALCEEGLQELKSAQSSGPWRWRLLRMVTCTMMMGHVGESSKVVVMGD